MPSACQAAGLVMPGFLDAALGAIASPSVRGVIDDAVFYCGVREFVIDGIVVGPYRDEVAVKLAQALGMLSMVIMTLWVAIQGFSFISGQAKQTVVPMLLRTGKIVLVLSLVTLLAKESPFVVESVEDFKDLISQGVADGADVTTLIDLNLGVAAMLSSINDSIRSVESQRDPNVVTSAVGLLGQSGPAMLTATLLLLTELSVTLAIMLSPVFIFFLIFQQTAPLFWSWAKFLLGALFSLATLTLVASLALQATLLYGATVVAAFFTNSGDGLGGIINTIAGGPFDINASSLRLAALGTLMSAIIISVPPVIMGFFGAAAAFTTGAMTAMGGGAMMLAQQMGAGKSAGPGIPALAAGQPAAAGAAGGGALLPAQQNPGYLTQQGSGQFTAGGGLMSSQYMQQMKSIFSGGSGEGGAAAGQAAPAGQRGLAPQPGEGGGSGGLNTVQMRERQLIEAQEMRADHTGVYRTASADAALAHDPSLGRQGHLPVSGAGGGGAVGAGLPASAAAGPSGTNGAAGAAQGSGGGNNDAPTHAGDKPSAPPAPQARPSVPEGAHTKNARNDRG